MTDIDTMIDEELDAASDAVSSERAGYGNIQKLPDGDHTFQVTDGELKKTAKAVVFTLKFSAAVGDAQYLGEKTYWLKGNKGVDERQINNLKADLKLLGFDVDNWTVANGRPFTAQLGLIKPLLPGLGFKGRKKTNPNQNDPKKPYVNIYLNERDADDGRPASFGAAEIEAASANDTPF